MKNYEAGYKSSFADGKGRLNLTYYNMKWEDYQLQALDPSFVNCIDPETGEEVPPTVLKIPHECGQPWQTLIANLGDASIDGFNVSLDYSPNENWVLGLNYENMKAETDSDHDLDGDGELDLVKGMRLPLVPDYKAAAWAEYHWPTDWLGAHDLFIRLQWSFTGDSVNRLEPLSPLDSPNPQFVNPSWNIGDLRAGLVGDDWQVDLFINNLTDERAIYTYNSGNGQMLWSAAQMAEGRPHHQNAYVARPREFGVRFTKSWGG
jgi:outer membrane receptor protein involved in Fe transport